jgi:hypothetical protein
MTFITFIAFIFGFNHLIGDLSPYVTKVTQGFV